MKFGRPSQPEPVRTAQVMLHLFETLETQKQARERLKAQHWCYW